SFGGSTLSSSDYATIKYSGAGVALWTNRYDGPGNGADNAVALATDSGGNVFVTGTSLGGFYDYATVAYSSTGMPLWTNRYHGPGTGENHASAIAVDRNGNVIVTGDSPDGYDSTTLHYATVAYSNQGIGLWTNRYNGPGISRDCATAIAVDRSGNVFVTGGSETPSGDYATVAY